MLLIFGSLSNLVGVIQFRRKASERQLQFGRASTVLTSSSTLRKLKTSSEILFVRRATLSSPVIFVSTSLHNPSTFLTYSITASVRSWNHRCAPSFALEGAFMIAPLLPTFFCNVPKHLSYYESGPSDECGNYSCGKISVKESSPKPNKRFKISEPCRTKAEAY